MCLWNQRQIGRGTTRSAKTTYLKHFKKTGINIHTNWKLTSFPSEEEGLVLSAGLGISEHSAIFHTFPTM